MEGRRCVVQKVNYLNMVSKRAGEVVGTLGVLGAIQQYLRKVGVGRQVITVCWEEELLEPT